MLDDECSEGWLLSRLLSWMEMSMSELRESWSSWHASSVRISGVRPWQKKKKIKAVSFQLLPAASMRNLNAYSATFFSIEWQLVAVHEFLFLQDCNQKFDQNKASDSLLVCGCHLNGKIEGELQQKSLALWCFSCELVRAWNQHVRTWQLPPKN